VDAYYGGAWDFHFPGQGRPVRGADAQKILCPERFPAELTETPIPPYLQVLNAWLRNPPSPDSPYFIAVDAANLKPGVIFSPDLPFHARLRGHLGERAFAACPHADRFFFVEQVVTTYQAKAPPGELKVRPPKDFATWATYRDPALGYSFKYPQSWKLGLTSERQALATIMVTPPEWPAERIYVRVYSNRAQFRAADPLFGDAGQRKALSASFEQGGGFFDKLLPSAGMEGETWLLPIQVAHAPIAAGFTGKQYYYTLALDFALGYESSQRLLAYFSAIVATVQLDQLPPPEPTRRKKP
jgi:hypothetical protein